MEEPSGLRYQADFLSEEEEQELAGIFEGLTFAEVRMHGQAAKRTVMHFGYRYEYDSRQLIAGDPLPTSLAWLRDRAGEFVDVDPELFVETLVTRYPAGAGIGWHRDAPMFGSKVVGVSLLSSCPLRFRRSTAEGTSTFELNLAPRSVYALTGSARWAWQHSIRATKALRYSVTFRTLAQTRAANGDQTGSEIGSEG